MESYHGVSIVYEDNHLLVVVKPPNMPTQADDSGDADLHSTMKAYIAERYSKPGAVYLGLVHRLDRRGAASSCWPKPARRRTG